MNRPNLLLVIADGMQAATIEPGHVCQTPVLDQLSGRGVQFNNAHTTCPTCSPARASLMTGLLPHNHGVLEVEHGRDQDQCVLRSEYPHFAQVLSGVGYDTAYFGKWHIERTQDVAKYGWAESVVKGTGHVQGLGLGDPGPAPYTLDESLCGYMDSPPGYRRLLHWGVTDTPLDQRYPGLTVSDAEQYLDSRLAAPSGKPWCCCVSFSEPNEALVVGRDAWEQYEVENMPLPANFFDDLSDRPNMYQRQQQIGAELDRAHWQSALAAYYGRITELDQMTGRLIDKLSAAGELENTIVVFVADHGRYVGSHGFDAHNFGGFEEIYRIPLVMAGPGIAAGEVRENPVSIADLGSTVCEIGSGHDFGHPDSTSFLPLLGDENIDSLSDFQCGYAEYHGTRFPLMQRILWKDGWKFVFNGFDFDELYHLDADPHEMRNRIKDPEQRGRVDDMMTEIWRRVQATGDRTIWESHYFSMRFASVGPQSAGPR